MQRENGNTVFKFQHLRVPLFFPRLSFLSSLSSPPPLSLINLHQTFRVLRGFGFLHHSQFFSISSPMMADFPPNLDDGELWLPSDIFLNDHCPCMLDDLAHNFAAMALQHPPRNRSTPPTYPSNNFQGFKPIQPPVRDESVLNPNATWPLGLSRSFHSLRGNSRTGCYAGWPEPSSKPLRSAPSQVDGFQETRRRPVLRRLQNRLPNHRLPFPGSGFVRESGGTGVFHPRALPTATFSTADAFRREFSVDHQRAIEGCSPEELHFKASYGSPGSEHGIAR